MAVKTLNSHTLIWAYQNGFFPMPDPDTQEICWYRPNPRAIIPLDGFHCSRSLQKRIRRSEYRWSIDQSFEEVMRGCADRDETWINDEFLKAYIELHNLGIAHSVEIYMEDSLAGGLYGVAIGGAFFAESMFHKRTDASKLAVYHLVEHLKNQGFGLLEVQFMNPHLKTLGAIEITDEVYMESLTKALQVRS